MSLAFSKAFTEKDLENKELFSRLALFLNLFEYIFLSILKFFEKE